MTFILSSTEKIHYCRDHFCYQERMQSIELPHSCRYSIHLHSSLYQDSIDRTMTKSIRLWKRCEREYPKSIFNYTCMQTPISTQVIQTSLMSNRGNTNNTVANIGL